MGIAETYFTESITITGRGSLTAFGTYSYDGGDTVTLSRLVNEIGLIKMPDGREINYNRVFYVSPSVSVAVGDRVTYGGVTHEVLVVYLVRDLAGIAEHIKLICGAK